MKLALNGQWKDISGPIYTFPDKLSGIPDWLQSVFDPRNARGTFKANYCYAVWYNDNGYYYGCIKTNTDARNGCVMLTLFAEKQVPLDGIMLAEKMRTLLDYCLSKNEPSEIAFVDVSLKAKEIEDLLVPRALPQDTAISASPDKKTAYWLYANDAELGLFLENPNQSSYAGYKCVLAIESSAFNADALAAQQLVRIADPIRKTYDIRSDSSDVVPSQPSVVEGDWFDVTYKKQGFVSETVRMVAGKASTYCFIEGNVINLRSAEAVGIVFKSEVILKVVDEETKSVIKKWSCKVDGRTQPDQVKADGEGYAHLKIDPNKPHKVLVSAEGYQSREFEVGVGERGYKTVPLRSLDEAICVCLELDNKETVTDTVRLKSNNALYGPLKKTEKDGESLQVKRPFFSRRNLVPIVILALAALALGGVTGHFVFRGGGQEQTVVPADSSMVKKLQDEDNKLKGRLNSTQGKEESKLDSLLQLYREVLNVSSEKIRTGQSLEDVGKALNKYEDIKGDKDKDANIGNILEDLKNIPVTTETTDDGNSGGGGNKPQNSQLPKPQDTLIQHLGRNVWDLNYLNYYGSMVKTRPKGQDTFKNLGPRLTGGDIDGLYNYSSIADYNDTWKELRREMLEKGIITGKDGKVGNQGLRNTFSDAIKAQAETKIIDLDELLNRLTAGE